MQHRLVLIVPVVCHKTRDDIFPAGSRRKIDKEISQVNWLYFNKHQLIKLNTRGRASADCSSAWSSSFLFSADHEKPQGSLEYLQEWQPNNEISPHFGVVTWPALLTFL